MKEVFNSILNKLKNIPNLYVAEDWGQLSIMQPPVNFPCVLIDIGEAEYSQLSRLSQMVDVELQLTLADIIYDGVDQGSPDEEKEREFQIFDLIDQIHAQLHGFNGTDFGPLSRVSIEKNIRDDTMRVFIIRYRFGYVDNSAVRPTTNVNVQPDIKKPSDIEA